MRILANVSRISKKPAAVYFSYACAQILINCAIIDSKFPSNKKAATRFLQQQTRTTNKQNAKLAGSWGWPCFWMRRD
jgi:hypothetical protein